MVNVIDAGYLIMVILTVISFFISDLRNEAEEQKRNRGL